MSDFTPSYWMREPLITGLKAKPKDGGILIIGAGLSGVSVAYWLLQKGIGPVTIVDFEPEKAASLRNCGHILYGTVESMKALVALYGREKAQEIWRFSMRVCHDVRDTVKSLNLECDYAQSGYLVIGIDEQEDAEIQDSVRLLRELGFASDYLAPEDVRQLGFRGCSGARFEPGSAEAHPVKFRNALLKHVLASGEASYYSGVKVVRTEDTGGQVEVEYGDSSRGRFEFAVIAANAYAPLVSPYFAGKRLIEPFRGQIITSAPLKHKFAVRYPHSFDHGYEYALVTSDNRLMIGGWRNHTPSGEVGTYDVMPNRMVEDGLKDFVQRHYDIAENVTWEYSWAGIMAASQTAFPFIGATTSMRIYACAGYTGHGFSWAHGSARLLAEIMAGEPYDPVAKYFDPRRS